MRLTKSWREAQTHTLPLLKISFSSKHRTMSITSANTPCRKAENTEHNTSLCVFTARLLYKRHWSSSLSERSAGSTTTTGPAYSFHGCQLDISLRISSKFWLSLPELTGGCHCLSTLHGNGWVQGSCLLISGL